MKRIFIPLTALAMMASCTGKTAADNSAEAAATDSDSVATVYFTSEISPEALVKIYEALGRPAEGRVAVKDRKSVV